MWWSVLICVTSIVVCTKCLNVYHEGSKTVFYPEDHSEYFGYTVLLTSNSLIIGAPKARNTIFGPGGTANRKISPGQAFSCNLNKLKNKNVTCPPLGSKSTGADITFQHFASNLIKDDIWFGATIAVIPNEKLLVCAPRWFTPYNDNKHLLANGACYIQTQGRGAALLPLRANTQQAFVTDGLRKEYGDYGTHLNYYAYGMAGFSVKVTNNNSIIMGAPGLLQWTGGFIEYKFDKFSNLLYFSKQPITNPYFTSDLGPDDYFGYSIESGVFEPNGKVLFVAGAPRSKSGYGQVLIFEPTVNENDPLSIKVKLRGPQLGSYFGATLCCADINGDGIADLLVGAPNYVKQDGGLPYDQGAVFVYITEHLELNFTMIAKGYVMGSGESGSRFGSAIADLGDIDGDGYNDIAIGAPWENDGSGAVYIYKGGAKGLKTQYIQKITVETAQGFGISISKGLDVDKNGCNDLAVGAHNSRTAYIFQCIPTIHVEVSIDVPDAMNLEENTSNFTAMFCVKASLNKIWSYIEIDLEAAINVDPEQNRVRIPDNSNYNIAIHTGIENCDERTVEVLETADLSKPISIKFNVRPIEIMKENSTSFSNHAARLSEDSMLDTSFDIQLMRGCGEDLICRPLLNMSFEPLNNPYIPGTGQKLGVLVQVVNMDEPSFGGKVLIKVPTSLKRAPHGCLLDGYNLTCSLPTPMYKWTPIEWTVELEYTPELSNKKIIVEAELIESEYKSNKTYKKEVHVEITPKANFSINGKALPNATITVPRDKINRTGNVTFVHNFEIINMGPSDWYNLSGQILIQGQVNLSSQIKGCLKTNNWQCAWNIPARTSLPIAVPLRLELGNYGNLFNEELKYNVTTTINIYHVGLIISRSTTTVILLEPRAPIWPIILGCIFGLLFLSGIVYVLEKFGFFSRKRFNQLQTTKDQDTLTEGTSSQTNLNTSPSYMDKSTKDLLEDSE